MSNQIKHGCFWVLADGTQCGKPVKYHVVGDEDEQKVRDYDPFCPEHMQKHKEQPIDDEEL